jgi:hypothetical protein
VAFEAHLVERLAEDAEVIGIFARCDPESLGLRPPPAYLSASNKVAVMFWATRVFPEDGWFAVQDQFEDEWERAGEPPDMMLVYAYEQGSRARICIGLPDRALFSAYLGFDEIDPADLPCPMSLLMGNEDEFKRLLARAG